MCQVILNNKSSIYDNGPLGNSLAWDAKLVSCTCKPNGQPPAGRQPPREQQWLAPLEEWNNTSRVPRIVALIFARASRGYAQSKKSLENERL